MLDKDLLNKLYRYSYTFAGDDDKAYDLLYSSIEKFLRSNHSDNPEAYIKRIIRNQFIDECRRNKIIQYEQIDDQSVTDIDFKSIESIIINSDMTEQIFNFLEPDEREILYLWAIEEYTTSEISIQLERPKGTILSKLHRMRKRITDNFYTATTTKAQIVSGEKP